MPISKILQKTSLSIEIKKGVDKAGDPIYTKKTFSNVKNNVIAQNAYEVAAAIKDVIAGGTGGTFLNETSDLVNS